MTDELRFALSRIRRPKDAVELERMRAAERVTSDLGGQAPPSVRAGDADGTLEPGRFNVWMRQDYLYLVESARLPALAAARAPS